MRLLCLFYSTRSDNARFLYVFRFEMIETHFQHIFNKKLNVLNVLEKVCKPIFLYTYNVRIIFYRIVYAVFPEKS